MLGSVAGVARAMITTLPLSGNGGDPGPSFAVFARFAAESRKPTIFGDGLQTRDFIHVSDVVRGLVLAAGSEAVGRGEAINLGTGAATTVLDLASMLGCPPPNHQPARTGEVRHSMANGSFARERLGFESRVGLQEGLATLD